MFENLEEVEERYNTIDSLLYLPETVNDSAKYTSLLKEQKSLSEVVEKYREYRHILQEEDEAKEILDSSSDKELRALAAQQLDEAREDKARCEQEL